MVGQPLPVLGQPVRIEAFDGTDDAGVQGLAAFLKQRPVGDFMGERVLEGVFGIGKEPASGKKQPVFQPTTLRVPDARARLGQTIGQTPALRWMLTSKRPATIRRLIPDAWRAHGVPAHVWPIISIESSAAARQRLPQIAQWRDLAVLLGVSCEPVVDAGVYEALLDTPMLTWLILGGASGPYAEHYPFDVDAALRAVDRFRGLRQAGGRGGLRRRPSAPDAS